MSCNPNQKFIHVTVKTISEMLSRMDSIKTIVMNAEQLCMFVTTI